VDPLSQRTLDDSSDSDLILVAEGREADGLPEPQGSPFLAISQLLWANRVRLARLTAAGLVVGALIALLIPSSYTANVRLMPPDSSSLTGGVLGTLMGSVGLGGSGGGSAGAVGSSIGSGLSDLLGTQKPGPLFVGILGCRTIADHIIDSFDLRKVYWRKTYLATRKKLASRTAISEDKRSGIITIEVEDHDRARAAAIAQAYVTELDRLLAQVNTSSASRERAFLEQRLAVINTELHDASEELSKFSSQNTTLYPEDQAKAMVEATAVLQGQLIAAESELSGLEQIYTPENVRVRSLQAHVSELRDQLNKLGGKNYTGSTTLDANSLYPSLRQLPVMAVRYGELYRRVKIDETIFALLTQECELAKVQEAKETPSVKVLDAAQIPEKRSGPPHVLIALTGAFLAFVFTGCWVVGREFWSEIDPNEPHKAFLSQEIIPALRRGVASTKSLVSRVGRRRAIDTRNY